MNQWQRMSSAHVGTDFVDPDDPTYIAENELFNAAQSIESAARKLSGLKPRRKPKVDTASIDFSLSLSCMPIGSCRMTMACCHDMLDIWLFDA